MNTIANIGKLCTGCGACKCLCPKNCIDLKQNSEGFFYPKILVDECVECGVCFNHCPELSRMRLKSVINAYAVISKEEELLSQSTSGGVFITIAKQFIKHGGVVFGTIIQSNNDVSIVAAHTLNELLNMQGSKYVQSKSSDAYREVKTCLVNNRKVLFTGTPCQIAGLYSYIGDHNNLYTIDLICHGTPSPGFFKKHLAFLEKKFNRRAQKVVFRTKSAAYRTSYTLQIFDENCWYSRFNKQDAYYNSFMTGKSFRESCYSCSYAQVDRVGNMTMGDFAQFEKFSDFHRYESTSSLLINDFKGEQLWKQVKNCFEFIPIDLEEEARNNKQLSMPTIRPEERNDIYSNLKSMDYIDFCKKYEDPLTMREVLSLTAKKHVPVWVLKLIRRR